MIPERLSGSIRKGLGWEFEIMKFISRAALTFAASVLGARQVELIA